MILYTLHSSDFDICSDKLDLNKSICSGSPNFENAYAWLHKKLGTDQILWCCHKKSQINYEVFPKIPQILWILEVPKSSILAYLDASIWCQNIILGINLYPNTIYENYSSDEWENLEQKFDKENPKEQTWDQVFLENENQKEDVELIIPFPAKKDWIIDKVKIENE